jgi:hypothetical protein
VPFIPEYELEKALVEAVHNPASAPNFYCLLLECDLLVLGSVEGQEPTSEKITLTPGGRLDLIPGNKDGSRLLPVFSSMARMQQYVKQESKYLSINGRALLELTRGAPVTLNPASEYGKELTSAQIQKLLDGVSRGEARTIIGEADYPAALVKMLTTLFASRPDIETAWVIQVTIADRAGEPHPLVGIETGSDWLPLLQAIKAAAEESVPGMVFDVQRVDRRNPAGMTGVLLQAAPFYQRRAPAPTVN